MASGFDNDTVYCTNLDFRGVSPVVPQFTTDGQMLFGKTGGNPQVALPSVSGGVTYTGSAGGGTWGFDASGISTGTLDVSHGGTGDTSFSAYQVVCGGTTSTNPLQVVASTGSSGQFLMSNGASALPSWNNAGFLEWTEVSASQGAVVNTGYYANGGGQVVLTLPASAAQFSFISVVGNGLSNSWRIAQNASQQIFYASQSSTSGAGGYIESSGQYQVVIIMCIATNNTWVVYDSIGNITVV